MFRRNYKVKGEDVDDYMVMQDFAYQAYISSILDTFLFEKGYSKRKLETLKIGLQKCGEELVHRKHLMFTQNFGINLEFLEVADDKQKMSIRGRFFNTQNELCAMAITHLYWFDYNHKEIVKPPKEVIG